MPTNISYRPILYLGESIDSEKVDKLKEELEQKPFFSGLFLVALSQSPADQLDIIDAKMLLQSYFQKIPIYVVGLAGSKEESMGLIEKILNDCLKERGDCSMRDYLS